MSVYSDIRDGLQRALVLNELVEGLRADMSDLASRVTTMADRLHGMDKRLVRIETLAELSVSTKKRLENPGE